jgi:molecular chaperone GrpE
MVDYGRPRYAYDRYGRRIEIPYSREASPPRAQARPPAAPEPPAPKTPDLAPRVAELDKQVEELTARTNELAARTRELEETLAAEREQAAEQRGKADSYLDLLQRTQADFLNYKRRSERERSDDAQAARAELLVQLLPVLDDLERALGQMPEELREHPWATGLPLVARQVRLALARAGLAPLGAPGEEFDPHLHEAVAYEPHAGYNEGQIATVIRPGYRLGERVIRPAQVTVAQGGQ